MADTEVGSMHACFSLGHVLSSQLIPYIYMNDTFCFCLTDRFSHSLTSLEFLIQICSSNSEMEDQRVDDDDDTTSCVVNIYPSRFYLFGSKAAVQPTHHTYFDQLQKLKSNYSTNGMRVCVEAVMLVELFKQPHLLVLQMRNSFFKLPGGRLRPGESDIEGLKRKLSNKLSCNGNGVDNNWEECLKVFLLKLPRNKSFIVPKNQKLLVVPIFQVHDNFKTYGRIISEVPSLLSRFSFNMNNL